MLAKQNIKQFLLILGIWPVFAHAQLQAWGDYPALPRQAATGQTEAVADPYRFLESLSDTQVRAWMKKQTDFSNGVLARIRGRDALLKRLKVLQSTEFGAGRLIEVRGMQFFTRTTADNRQQLFMRNAATNAERLLLLTEPGQGIGFFTPSLDGSHVAVDLLNSGRQRHSLRIIKAADASMLKDNLDNIAADSKEIAWKPDSTAILLSQVPSQARRRSWCGLAACAGKQTGNRFATHRSGCQQEPAVCCQRCGVDKKQHEFFLSVGRGSARAKSGPQFIHGQARSAKGCGNCMATTG